MRRIGWWIAVVAWAGVIFAWSAQPGSNIPGRFSEVGHFGEYAILGSLLVLAIGGPKPLRAAAIALVIASVYAATDEFHQSFVPGRTPDVADWGMDTLGALAGALLTAGALAWLHARRPHPGSGRRR